MQLISEWLRNTCGSHDIQDADKLQADFKAKTGKADKLPSYTVAETRRAIDARGLGGSCAGKPTERVCWGWDVAVFLADRYGDPNETLYKLVNGRGSQFWAAVKAIEKAEKAGGPCLSTST